MAGEPLRSAQGRPWRLLLTGRLPGAENMALDEALLLCAAEQSLPTLRLYGWEPACLSIGYFQRADNGIDLNTVARHGWRLVRRPTGGRALLHDDELTYSLALPPQHPLAEGGVLPCYRRISAALVRGLTLLGIQTDPPRRVSGVEHRPSSAACFDSASHYEITVGGRKIAGSAQIRRDGAVLQHGSLLLDLPPHADAWRDADSSSPEGRATSACEALGRRVSFEEAAEAVRRGFEEALGVELVPGAASEQERETARRLAAEKYASNAWNLRR